jgi:hypothetical protein
MPLRRYPQPLAGLAAQLAAEIPPDAEDDILASIIAAAKEGTQSYHVGSRGLQRYSLKDRMELWSALRAQLPGIISGSAIQVRRGVPTDT